MTALAAPRLPRTRLRRIRPVLILAASLAIVAGTYALNAIHPAPATKPVTPVTAAVQPPIAAPGEAPSGGTTRITEIDHALKAWTTNLAQNDKDFLSATNIARLYDARGRLTGDVGDYGRAQAAVDQALVALPAYLPAEVLQARLLQTLHDFPGALAAAQAILQKDPTVLQALATAGDAMLELGDVKGASAAFASLEKQAPGPAVTARLARLAFIQGDTTAAISLAQRAWDEAKAADASGASLGWYAYLAGMTALSTGSPEAAATWFDKAVTAWPGSYLALTGKARAAAALGDTTAAIAGYQAAIAIAPQPDALTALGDLLALGGDAAGAEDQYATVLAIAKLQGAGGLVYNRQLVLFDINHDRDLATALTLAQHELVERHDAYGFDAYAWALLANGRATEAQDAMTKALAFGTRDALLQFHAGEIRLALGDAAGARTLLADALSIRGGLDPLATSKAASDLAAIR